MEVSSLSSPIPPDALHKLSMTDIDTELLTKQVRDRLIRHGICQRVFGKISTFSHRRKYIMYDDVNFHVSKSTGHKPCLLKMVRSLGVFHKLDG